MNQVRTLVYVVLTGQAGADILKQAGIKIGTKMSAVLIKRIPFEVIKQINKSVGFRLVTKFGQTGVINLEKGILLVGGIIGVTVDAVGTNTIGKQQKEFLIKIKIANNHNTCRIVINTYKHI